RPRPRHSGSKETTRTHPPAHKAAPRARVPGPPHYTCGWSGRCRRPPAASRRTSSASNAIPRSTSALHDPDQLADPRRVRVLLRQALPDALHDLGIVFRPLDEVSDFLLRLLLGEHQLDGLLPIDLLDVGGIQTKEWDRVRGGCLEGAASHQ